MDRVDLRFVGEIEDRSEHASRNEGGGVDVEGIASRESGG